MKKKNKRFFFSYSPFFVEVMRLLLAWKLIRSRQSMAFFGNQSEVVQQYVKQCSLNSKSQLGISLQNEF